MGENALEVRGLTKRYKDFTLDNVSFSVPQGSRKKHHHQGYPGPGEPGRGQRFDMGFPGDRAGNQG